MEILRASRNNLASVLMGKNIQFPWRGQRDVVITVPYEEWILFIREYSGYLNHRAPLDYRKALVDIGTDTSIRYFLYDISWAQYSELACSSNVSKDSTLILPHFDNGRVVSMDEVMSVLKQLPSEDVIKCNNSLKAITRNYYNLTDSPDMSFGLVDLSNLSEWNMFVFRLCLYLQSKSNKKYKTEQINIDWRSI